ncbi:MAG: hypothetical protein K2K96_09745 [Lachnospiraceae bacterium]|nr:hypothetical protein [Lachnospiraceae bacterium]
MNESYMEYMVHKRFTAKDRLSRILIIVLTVFFFSLSPMIPLSLIIAAILAAIAYFVVFPCTDLEYEYLYCDKQITVDKIMAKKKRKQVAIYDTDKIELLAPANSYRLKAFEHRTFKEVPLWSLKEDEHVPYVMIYEGNQKVILDLPAEFVKLVQNAAPRKVYFD